MTIPDFVQKYYSAANREAYFRNAPVDPSSDFNMQMAKLANGLLSGAYSQEPAKSSLNATPGHLQAPKGIKPTTFKSLIGRGHPEFSTKRQQDSHEFLTHLISLIERSIRTDTVSPAQNPVDSFRFKVQDRIECTQSKQCKYTYRDDFFLSLPIAKDLAINKDQVNAFEQRKAELEKQGLRLELGDIVRPEIRLTDCIKLFMEDGEVDGFYSSAAKAKVKALKSTRMATLPDYLMIQAKKFEYAPDWSPIKLNVSLQVPDLLDINELRGSGLRPGEVLLADEPEPQAASNQQVCYVLSSIVGFHRLFEN